MKPKKIEVGDWILFEDSRYIETVDIVTGLEGKFANTIRYVVLLASVLEVRRDKVRL